MKPTEQQITDYAIKEYQQWNGDPRGFMIWWNVKTNKLIRVEFNTINHMGIDVYVARVNGDGSLEIVEIP